MNIGKTIYLLRKEQHMTQEELSFRSGLAPRTITQLENNGTNTRISTLIEVCKALDVELSELIREAERIE